VTLFLLLFAGAAEARSQVLFSPSGTYAFPLAGNTSEMAWTHYHWDGGNAVDILPAPRLEPGSPAFAAFDHSAVVAVVAGRVQRADNDLGGTALLLFGDDGREYYYAHLSRALITVPTRVKAGQQIGTIGRTGRWAQYIEIHLHFAISSKWHEGLFWKNDVNVAEWLEKTFGLGWIDQNPISYPPAFPHGSPLRPPYRLAATFAGTRTVTPDAASLRMQPLLAGSPSPGGLSGSRGSTTPTGGGRRAPPRQVPVFSTLTGAVRVMRGTVLGLRVQITNLHTAQTVVYSGLSETPLTTGDVVNNGQIVGLIAGTLDYMYFDHGVLTDPGPTLTKVDSASHAGNLLD